ncbi:hypothetical protein T01_14017 [Trichinella spiralis]|uniref:Uncharacterized protein n=1 Tax=Trichinella spiralis TaxID=6334 RepID=A0A0V1ARG7_TRISP|nr:hypothetical protein T01_14017 [Trichinella spiralis]
MAVNKVLLMLPFIGIEKVIMCRREVVSGSAEFLFCMGFHERLQERWCFIRFPCYVGNEDFS